MAIRRRSPPVRQAAAWWPLGARAQQGEKVYKIGILSAGSPPPPGTRPIVSDALRELGYVGAKKFIIEPRYAKDRLDRLPGLAAELVSLKVDVIMAVGTLAPLAAKRATSTIPIVMIAAGDPVGSELVASLAHPGGNVTGTSLMSPDLGGKRLELLKELLPQLSRVAVLWNAANPYSALVFKATVGAAQTVEIALQSLEIRGPADIDAALEAATDALITVEDPLTIDLRKKIAEFAVDHQLPAIAGLRMFADAGLLMSYGANLGDIIRRSVVYVDKILKGTKPSD
ncbi:MAG: ABC transporter substrate-binding protein, partial [Deltaproteobacteria bacterium]|nr:ABC transporter substrate-binding protein [Deltaproteobacteria bacterium]